MGDVENAYAISDCPVFGEDRLILKRHLPAPEVGEASAKTLIQLMEWRAIHPVRRSPRSSRRTTAGAPGIRVGATASSRFSGSSRPYFTPNEGSHVDRRSCTGCPGDTSSTL